MRAGKGLGNWMDRFGKKVINKIEMLSDFKSLNTVKKMEGKDKDYYRMRAGDLRILFIVMEDGRVVWVTDIGFRGSVYR